jgi:hypothetical protein
MRLNKTGKVVLGLLILLLLFAWYDGGREPQRLIEQSVALEAQQ